MIPRHVWVEEREHTMTFPKTSRNQSFPPNASKVGLLRDVEANRIDMMVLGAIGCESNEDINKTSSLDDPSLCPVGARTATG